MQLDHERVRWHRDRLGWTLDTLAEKAEVAKGTVLRAEHGEDVRPSSGRRIARALGTEISELIPDKPRRVEELAGKGKAEAPPAGRNEIRAGHSDKPEEEPAPVYFRHDILTDGTVELVRQGRLSVDEAVRLARLQLRRELVRAGNDDD
jgi:transcriptional regulator with XRE-family HTH domain